ncbi:hypothetical protein FNAPI_5516 [Fusarium napiforme]|uniref:Uncharacterized protein n=1 Tax=Fusarium napiforme TaxID=42672 RepID=A0A8H5NA28_9HYPO|nr:hypothetical protein FNAPI_5516 [Fusarium napiforme]
MLFNVFTTAALALLAAPALANPIDTLPAGLESHLESRASDVVARFWDSTTCRNSLGDRKPFNSGHCIKSLREKEHAVSMAERKKSSCHSELSSPQKTMPRSAYQLSP